MVTTILLNNDMKTEKKTVGAATITLSVSELITINNALNEVCNALHVDEFQTRIGATIEEARELLSSINQVLQDDGGQS